MGQVDYFISHAGSDRAWAEWVAFHLHAAGYTVELDTQDWTSGDDVLARMQHALDNAGRMVALFSKAYFDGRYSMMELRAWMHSDDGSCIASNATIHGRLITSFGPLNALRKMARDRTVSS